MSRLNITTIDDARTITDSVAGWQWSGNASYDGYVDFVYSNHESDEYSAPEQIETIPDEHNPKSEQLCALLIGYLKSVGENPSDYGV